MIWRRKESSRLSSFEMKQGFFDLYRDLEILALTNLSKSSDSAGVLASLISAAMEASWGNLDMLDMHDLRQWLVELRSAQ